MDIRCNECKVPLGGRKRATSHSRATGHNAHPAFECKECRVAFKRLMCYEAHLVQCATLCPPPTLVQTDSPPGTPAPTTPPPMVLHPENKPGVAATVLPVDPKDGSAADTETELESTRGQSAVPPRKTSLWHCRACLCDPCDEPVATVCGHIFCRSCIVREMERTCACPACQQVFFVKLDV